MQLTYIVFHELHGTPRCGRSTYRARTDWGQSVDQKALSTLAARSNRHRQPYKRLRLRLSERAWRFKPPISRTRKQPARAAWPDTHAEMVASTLYAARGRLIPLSVNSPTGSTATASSTAMNTRGLISICPGLASSHRREATLATVPIAA